MKKWMHDWLDSLEEPLEIEIPTQGNLEEYLYNGIKAVINACEDDDVYSINFFIYSNEENSYQGIDNVCEFGVSCNKESYYKESLSLFSNNFEQRWDYACLEQDDYPLLDDIGMEKLFQWYKEHGITNIGYEDEDMLEPVGYKELLGVMTEIGIQLQQEDYLKAKFGRRLPIIVQTLEVGENELAATQKINIHGEADEYLKGAKKYYL